MARLFQVEASTTEEVLAMTGADPAPPPGEREVAIVILGDDAPADPFGSETPVVDLTGTHRRSAPRRAPVRGSVAGASGASVFPEPGSATFVYSDAPIASPRQIRRMTRRRWLVMAVALVALGIALWWAFGELGQGLSSVVDRLGVPPG